MPAMADLEEHAIKRDKRFLVRLILMLAAGLLAGLWAYNFLTSDRTGACAAESFGGVTEQPPAQGR